VSNEAARVRSDDRSPEANRGLAGWTIDQDGLVVPAEVDASTLLDVHCEGRRIWTVLLEDYLPRDGAYRVPWPRALLNNLDGIAAMSVHEHGSDTRLAHAELTFGTSQQRVSLVDEHGRDLVVHKWGKLNQSFDAVATDVKEAYLDQVQEILDILTHDCDVPAFLSFGTLLGAVRSGQLIGHDVDVDLGYFTNSHTPADAMRESFAIERRLRGRGWRVVRANGGFLQLFLPQRDGSNRNIDVFTAMTIGGRLYQVNDVATDATADSVLPLGTIELEGRTFPAPADPEVFLRAAYGEGWRVPDPSFSYSTNPERRKIRAWFGGLREERDQWGTFYTRHGEELPSEPSPFAAWALERTEGNLVLDVGCGNGRDTEYFARSGRRAVGFDVTGRLVRARRAASRGNPEVTYHQLNLASLRETLVAAARATRRRRDRDVYARFLLHNLSAVSEDHFWRFCSMVLRGGERCVVEFRTTEDADLPKHFDQPRRRYLDPDEVAGRARAHGGHEVQRLVGRGLAVFEAEDPHVCRLVLEWT
jgi:SAM-dependent methyltransferase